MKVIPFVHEGLGNSSYVVELPSGDAVVIDPDRNVGRYLAAAEANGLRLAHALETHLHADFISGSHELASRGVTVWAPAAAGLEFDHKPVTPSAELRLGGVACSAIGSPGHTPEHLAYTLQPPSGPPMLFSGGSLLAGGAARTDLIAPRQTETLTRQQFHSIHEAFAHLPDATHLLPTHGGGSFCSSGASGERTSTLGFERRHNAVLEHRDEDEFVRWFPGTFPAAPDYFFKLRPINRRGARLGRDITSPPLLDADAFAAAMAEGAVVIDARAQAEFMAAHIRGSLSNTFRDAFATWLGWLVPLEASLLFVPGDARIEDIVGEALLVGFERFAGLLAGGMAAWTRGGRSLESAPLIDAEAATKTLAAGGIAIDVREDSEYCQEHIPGALHIPLGSLSRRLGDVPRDRPLVTYCGHGERSATALSLLRRAGFERVLNLDLGIGAWQDAGLEVQR
jgi:rhodanese-related sulfurtransferase/glyoxylase-like metal-dependent hydrolase (beta-lactamase superfamily II)